VEGTGALRGRETESTGGTAAGPRTGRPGTARAGTGIVEGTGALRGRETESTGGTAAGPRTGRPGTARAGTGSLTTREEASPPTD